MRSYRNLLVLSNCLLIFILIDWSLEDADLVMSNIVQDLHQQHVNICQLVHRLIRTHTLLELNDLLICESIGLSDDGDQVNLGVEATHKLNIDLLEAVETLLDKLQSNPNIKKRTSGRKAE
jgi:hypothetical protein